MAISLNDRNAHPETELFFVSRFVWQHRQADVASHETKGYLCYINGVLTDNEPPGLSRTGFLSRRGRWRSRETSLMGSLMQVFVRAMRNLGRLCWYAQESHRLALIYGTYPYTIAPSSVPSRPECNERETRLNIARATCLTILCRAV